MAPLSPTTRNITDNDELDDILNGIVEGRDIADSSNAQTQPLSTGTKNGNRAEALGVDEEIIVSKKRAPVPKLDDHRLLSDPGIPKLRKISKDRLRFKGKGHEYGDIARMLNMYQIWLDDLYPRAKFADALAIIEKVGHTKRMQMMRKDWIDEGKPRRTREDEEANDNDVEAASRDLQADNDVNAMDGLESRSNNDIVMGPVSETGRKKDGPMPQENEQNDDPDDDELDALLAEDAQSNFMAPKTLPVRTVVDEDPFADEMDALADMQDLW